MQIAVKTAVKIAVIFWRIPGEFLEGILSGNKQHENDLRNSLRIHPEIHRKSIPKFTPQFTLHLQKSTQKSLCRKFAVKNLKTGYGKIKVSGPRCTNNLLKYSNHE